MSFKLVEINSATGETKASLEAVKKAFGGVPNLMGMLANAPKVLDGYLAFNQKATSGSLSTGLIEQIALAVSGINQCEYCVAVHVAIGQQLKISREELINNIEANSSDPRTDAILKFAADLTQYRGKVQEAVLKRLQEFKISSEEQLEILAIVGIYTFLNYLNHLTQPAVDFPSVEEFTPMNNSKAA